LHLKSFLFLALPALFIYLAELAYKSESTFSQDCPTIMMTMSTLAKSFQRNFGIKEYAVSSPIHLMFLTGECMQVFPKFFYTCSGSKDTKSKQYFSWLSYKF
jgi:hypothetical protein